MSKPHSEYTIETCNSQWYCWIWTHYISLNIHEQHRHNQFRCSHTANIKYSQIRSYLIKSWFDEIHIETFAVPTECYWIDVRDAFVYSRQRRRMHGKTSNGWIVCQQYMQQTKHATSCCLIAKHRKGVQRIYSIYALWLLTCWMRSGFIQQTDRSRLSKKGKCTVHKQSGESVTSNGIVCTMPPNHVRLLRHKWWNVLHTEIVYLELTD